MRCGSGGGGAGSDIKPWGVEVVGGGAGSEVLFLFVCIM